MLAKCAPALPVEQVMRIHRAIPFLLTVLPLGAQTLVSPIGYETREGSGENAYPFARTMRFQQFHPDLKGVARTIKALAFRRDGLDSQPAQTSSIVVTVKLGTCDLATVTSAFASNYAAAGTTVATSKTVNLPDWSPDPTTIPAPFTLSVPFDTNYAYAGVKDLLWEMAVTTLDINGRYADTARNNLTTTYGTTAMLGTGCTTASGKFTLLGSVWSDTGEQQAHAEWKFKGGPVLASCALLLGTSDPDLPIPGLCGGGRLRTDAAISIAMGSTNTGTHTPIDLGAPYGGALVGRSLFGQFVAVDATQGSFPIAASNGLRQTIPAYGPNAAFGRLYAVGSTNVTTGTLDKTGQLVTRFSY
jgi:hypothetical protein